VPPAEGARPGRYAATPHPLLGAEHGLSHVHLRAALPRVPAEEARVLAQIVRAARCRSICEIGTSYGFSTLHLTAARAAVPAR
jgi:predicted O-methyltransferase YrrM